ncbi:MAG: tRNA methyltransferase [Desulfobulbus propionicus]|nr:MAG: tRNA methyltransferase [Desulfobulbus propionicus]
MTIPANQQHPLAEAGIILVNPRIPENIGAAARIAHNFGIRELLVVGERTYDEEAMLKMATHKAAHLIRNLRRYQSTAEAASPFHFLVATTARQGKQRLPLQEPREVMAEVAPLAAQSRVALMFGPENAGLTNEDLDLCQWASTIPTADFASLNLAQAVAIHCYELSTAVQALASQRHEPATSDYANSFDLEGMYGHLAEALEQVTFLQETNRTFWMRNIRQFLGRMHLTKKEASMVRGICRKFLWHQTRGPGAISARPLEQESIS